MYNKLLLFFFVKSLPCISLSFESRPPLYDSNSSPIISCLNRTTSSVGSRTSTLRLMSGPLSLNWKSKNLVKSQSKRWMQHIGSFSQNSFQIDSINSCNTLKKLQFWLKIVSNIYFLTLKPMKGLLGCILKITKKNARWRHKSEI